MKKKIQFKIGVGVAIALMAAPALSFAQVPQTAKDVFCLFSKIIDLLFGVLIALTVFFVVMAAYKYLTSGGDPEKVKEASHQLLYAAIAIMVGLFARAVPSIVGSVVNVPISSDCNSMPVAPA